MSTTLKQFHVRLITRSFYDGVVEAESAEDAEERTYHLWRTECPHPFERCDDDELIAVETDEVTPMHPVPIDTRLADIAKTALGIPTLETRGADSLDFHTVSVWQVRQALHSACLSGDAKGGIHAEILSVLRRFVETADDYLPDGIDDPAYSPEAELLSDARNVLAKCEGGAS